MTLAAQLMPEDRMANSPALRGHGHPEVQHHLAGRLLEDVDHDLCRPMKTGLLGKKTMRKGIRNCFTEPLQAAATRFVEKLLMSFLDSP